MIELRVLLVGPVQVPLPRYQTAHSAGLDLQAALGAPITLEPGARCLVPTGLAVAVPLGYEAQVRPRSGLARDWGVTVLNAPGTIDADYRGEISVLLVNHGERAFEITPLARIAQLVICPVARAELVAVDALDETARGAGGYGSTGR